MPLNTNLDVNPYFDDYNANNLYYRILFKPAVALQARELNQLQSILQNQVEKFGNWAFQNGDIVSGCGIQDLPNLSYVRLADFNSSNNSYNITQFVNTLAVSASSNLTARVVYATQGLTSNYPNTNIAYLTYINTGIGGQQVFANNEVLNFYNVGNNTPLLTVNTYATPNSTANVVGNAHGISVSTGVAFLNGTFVNVLTPTIGIINAYGYDAGNSVVGFILNESIVTADEDSSLYDNALGYPNQNAPGADRLKLQVGLLSLADQSLIAANSGFNPIAIYNYNSLIATSNATSNLYSIVGDAIAQRVYDESGNFVINPFVVDTITSANSIVSNISPNNVLARVGTGSGYSQGQPVSINKTAYINMRRGVDLFSKTEQLISFNYGGYFVLNEVAGSFDFPDAANVSFYNSPQKAVTTRTFNGINPVGTKIGTATVKCFTYSAGTVGTNNAIYLLHVYNITMISGYNVNQIQSVYYGGSSGPKGVGDLYVQGLIGATYDDQLYTFGVPGLMNLRDSTGTNSTEFIYRTQNTAAMSFSGSTGTATYTIPAGNDELPYGIGILSDATAQQFIVVNSSNTYSANLSGTVTVYSTNTYVLGSGTAFTSNFSVGSHITVGTSTRTITSVINATAMNVDAAFPANNTAQYYRNYPAGKIMGVGILQLDTPSFINVTNSTSFTLNMTFNSGIVPAFSGGSSITSMPVEFVFNVQRTNASPAGKVINKNRFVQIDTTSNPTGPWCLGFPDVHQVTAVYSCTTPSYSTSNPNVTTSYVFDSGASDSSYGLGYLYPTTPLTSNTYLLVQLDYFSVNTQPGYGFFTVESYPIDDANTANTNAIQTTNIPLYVDTSGNQRWLRDYIDFRTPVVATANDTGYCNTANAAQVTTAISYASTVSGANPSNTVTYVTPIINPAYGQNMQADYTVYLPRTDLLYITPTNVLQIKEGVSSLSPQPPLYPDNAMAISVINVPPYPSLTSDQVNQLSTINKTSKNLCRNTNNAISTTLVTNKRYTMADIGKLDSRITNLEYYVSLNLLQQSATNLTVTNSLGLDRFKNGIFADPFNDFTYSDVSDPAYSIAIDSQNSLARPKIVREVINVSFNNNLSSQVQQTGRAITLPYTETQYITQPYATKYRSAAPVAFSWLGTLTLIPTYDNQVDTTTTGSINVTINNTTAWNQFASSPFGSLYGDWNTTTTVTSNTVITGTPVYNCACNSAAPSTGYQGMGGPGGNCTGPGAPGGASP